MPFSSSYPGHGTVHLALTYVWMAKLEGALRTSIPVVMGGGDAAGHSRIPFNINGVTFEITILRGFAWNDMHAQVDVDVIDLSDARIIGGELVRQRLRDHIVKIDVCPNTEIEKTTITLHERNGYNNRTRIGRAAALHGVEMEGGTYIGKQVRANGCHIMRSRHERNKGTAPAHIGNMAEIGNRCMIGHNLGDNSVVGTNVNVQQSVGKNIILPDNFVVTNPIADAAQRTEMDYETLELFGMFQEAE